MHDQTFSWGKYTNKGGKGYMKKLMLLAIVLAFTAGMAGCHKEEATEQAAPAVTTQTTTTAAPASPTTAAPAK